MTVRILEQVRNGKNVIRVDGWLDGEDEAAELLRVAREAPFPEIVDLEHLRSSDSFGIKALRALHREGARLYRSSDFIKLLLAADGKTWSLLARSESGDLS